MSLPNDLPAELRRLYGELADMDVLDLATRLTLVLLIVYSGSYWYLRVPMTLLCVVGILFRALYRQPRFWLLLTAVMFWGNFYNWFEVDNHKYLMSYWCLALFCSLSLSDARAALASNARMLIGLSFLFAALWKVISPDYLDGGFFRYTFLVDGRFEHVAEVFGGVSEEAMLQNGLALRELKQFDSAIERVQLKSGPGIPALAGFFTVWTLLIEVLIAAAFLLPPSPAADRVRNPLLLIFGLTTYSVATVVGFGWLLMVMGAAQCPREHKRTRVAYVVVFFVIQAYTTPWISLLRAAANLVGNLA